MNVDIIEFYELFRDDSKEILQGTLHVRLVDLDIDLRGVFVSRKKNFWLFTLPGKRTKNAEGIDVRFPFFAFVDRDKTRLLQQIIKEKGVPFILERTTALQPAMTSAKITDRPKMASFGSPNSIAQKEYRDLPPRKKAFRRHV